MKFSVGYPRKNLGEGIRELLLNWKDKQMWKHNCILTKSSIDIKDTNISCKIISFLVFFIGMFSSFLFPYVTRYITTSLSLKCTMSRYILLFLNRTGIQSKSVHNKVRRVFHPNNEILKSNCVASKLMCH